jgi:hypothetical protein
MHKSLFIVAAASAVLAAGTAHAKPVTAALRVEAAGKALETGNSYVTDTATVKTDTRPACGGTGNTKTISGATAMGLLPSSAAVNPRLRPLGISDKFSFGLVVCGVGQYVGFGTESFWLYKVNHKSPEVGGDQYKLKAADDVLWFFQDTKSGANTGDELVLDAPARAKIGQQFTVTVLAYDFNGVAKPAAGAAVAGSGVKATTDAQGKAKLTITRASDLRLRATRGNDIASNQPSVCIGTNASCPAVRGKTIVGQDVADTIKGTSGPDRVNARGGADRINVRGGGTDLVGCGKGKDVVIADKRDAIGKDCEKVTRR